MVFSKPWCFNEISGFYHTRGYGVQTGTVYPVTGTVYPVTGTVCEKNTRGVTRVTP